MTLDPQIAEHLRDITERIGDDFETTVADFDRQSLIIVDDEPTPGRLTRLRSKVSRRTLIVGVGAVLASAAFIAALPAIDGGVDESDRPNAMALAAPDADSQRVVLDGDTLYLEGTVPTQEVSDVLESTAVAAVGQDRVVNNFVISSAAAFDPEHPIQLTVADPFLFTFGRADLEDRYRPLVEIVVDLMSAEPSSTLSIVGHTDSIGPETANVRLSLDRAETVASLVTDHGIERKRLTVEGRGETDPTDTNSTPEGRAVNRRVEFSILGVFGT